MWIGTVNVPSTAHFIGSNGEKCEPAPTLGIWARERERERERERGFRPGSPQQILAGIDGTQLVHVDADDRLSIFDLAYKAVGAHHTADTVAGMKGEFAHGAFAGLGGKTDDISHDRYLLGNENSIRAVPTNSSIITLVANMGRAAVAAF
jgi:hypothetical protein